MSDTLSRPPLRRPLRTVPDPTAPLATLAFAVLIGVGIGVATCSLQGVLSGPFASLANAASPWLTGAFVAGAVARSTRTAVVAGLLSCLGEVAGYYTMTDLRGFGVSSTEVVFWSVCGLLAGPVLAWAGQRWWRGVGDERAPGVALLPACFAGEAIGVYTWQLHYYSTAVLFGVIAVVAAAVLLGVAGRSVPVVRTAVWFVSATALAAILAGPVLNHIGNHLFTL